MKISSINTSFIDYPNKIAMIIYMTGCDHKCKGCHNIELQNIKYGFDITLEEIVLQYNKMKLCNVIVFSGGDPLYQYDELLQYCKELSKITDICIYTGENIENIPNELFEYIKIIKTGKYVEQLGPITSNKTNQKIWDIVNNIPIENKKYFKNNTGE